MIRTRLIDNILAASKIKYFDFLNPYARASFSQEAEDLILQRIFENRKNGFYVDVGAHHPIRFSNTFLLYRQGWRGINIDARPGSMTLFKKHRALDMNIESGVGNTKSMLTFYMFDEPALNSFDRELSEERAKIPSIRIIEKRKIKILPLYEILDNHLPQNVEIDLLNVDVEGMDLDVLKSNNWSTYRPNIVVAEANDFKLDDISNSELNRFLESKDYHLIAKTNNTIFYSSAEFSK